MLSGAGDITAQRIEQRETAGQNQVGSQNSTGKAALEQSVKPISINWGRAFAMASFSGVFASALYVPFFRALDLRLGEGLRAAALKTAADNLLMCPLVGLPLFFAWTSTVQGHSWEQGTDRFRAHYPATYLTSLAIWVPFGAINFTLCPPHLRVISSYFAEFCWAGSVSLLSNREVGTEAASSAEGPAARSPSKAAGFLQVCLDEGSGASLSGL